MADVAALRVASTRLDLRLGSGHPVAQTLRRTREAMGSAATTMSFGASGTISPGGADLEDAFEEFQRGLSLAGAFIKVAKNEMS
jgi:hypothetical protein